MSDGLPKVSKSQRLWLTHWNAWARYHRYEVHNIETLYTGEPMLIVGYHGRPLAYDMCMLTAKLHERLGYLPHGIVHKSITRVPKMGRFVESLGFVSADGDALEQAVARREHIVTTPGGADEGMRSVFENYRVDWGTHRGYIRLALRLGLRIVPVAAAGADSTYIGLTNGRRMAGRLGLNRKWSWATWGGLGPLGPYPFSPPFPVKLTQLIGPPIATDGVAAHDRAAIEGLHDRVTYAVQRLLERARAMN